MTEQPSFSLLTVEGVFLKDSKRRTVAVVNETQKPERVSAFAHLFGAAPELCRAVEEQVSEGMKIVEANLRPKPTLTGYRGYSSRNFSDIPQWLDRSLQALAIAYGEKSPNGGSVGLSISGIEDNAIQTSDGDIAVRMSSQLDEASARSYLCLFLAAPKLLGIIDGMVKDALGAMEQQYQEGQDFEQHVGDDYRFIFPDKLRRMSALVAKAKGAVPIDQPLPLKP